MPHYIQSGLCRLFWTVTASQTFLVFVVLDRSRILYVLQLGLSALFLTTRLGVMGLGKADPRGTLSSSSRPIKGACCQHDSSLTVLTLVT